MSRACVLSVDIGTSSVRATVYDARGVPVANATCLHQQHVHTTADGGAEMRPDEVVQRVVHCAEGAMERAGQAGRRVIGVGVSCYWHSTLGVDAHDRALTPAFLWSDTRSVTEVAHLRRVLDADAVHARTGCPLHPSYVAPKILWYSRTHPERFRECRRWMSVGEYLFLRLFGEPRCSYSMASGTGMFDLAGRQWDPEVLAALPITPEQLSHPVERNQACRGLRPSFASHLPRLRGVPWYPPLGDGACSNVGSGALNPDRIAVMLGTSGAMRALLSSGQPRPPEGLWAYLVDGRRYLLGGALGSGGSLYTWMVNTLRAGFRQHVEDHVGDLEPDAHGLTVLPFLMGERSVGWRGDARAAIIGLSAHTRPIEIIRAGLEAVAYNFALIYQRLHPRLPPPSSGTRQLVATGGALLHSPAWMQILADVLNEPVTASKETQASSRGAALLALETLAAAAFPYGETRLPDARRHARYQEGLARQQEIYRRLIGDQ